MKAKDFSTKTMAISPVVPVVIDFKINFNKNINTGYGFREWRYAIINMFLWENPPVAPKGDIIIISVKNNTRP